MRKIVCVFLVSLIACILNATDSPVVRNTAQGQFSILVNKVPGSMPPMTRSEIEQLIDYRYGNTVDKIATYITVAFGLLGLIYIGALSYIWVSNKQSRNVLSEAKDQVDDLKNSCEKQLEMLEQQASDFQDIMRLSFSMDINEYMGAPIDGKTEERDSIVMKKIQLIDKYGNLTPDDLEAKGVLLARKKFFVEAYAIFKALTELEGCKAEIFYKAGYCAQHMGLYSDAELMYKQAIALVPKYIDAINNLAYVQVKQEKFEEAKEAYQAIISISPNTEPGWAGLVDVAMKQKQYKQARALLDLSQKYKASGSYLRYNLICLDAIEIRWDDIDDRLIEYVKEFPDRKDEILTDSDLQVLFSEHKELRDEIFRG